MKKNQIIGEREDCIPNKLTEERSHVFVKELQRSSEKIFKYENYTYVSIFGPERKRCFEKQKYSTEFCTYVCLKLFLIFNQQPVSGLSIAGLVII